MGAFSLKQLHATSLHFSTALELLRYTKKVGLDQNHHPHSKLSTVAGRWGIKFIFKRLQFSIVGLDSQNKNKKTQNYKESH